MISNWPKVGFVEKSAAEPDRRGRTCSISRPKHKAYIIFLRVLAMVLLWGVLYLVPDDPSLIILEVWFALIVLALLAIGFPWPIMALVFAFGGAVAYLGERYGTLWGFAALLVIMITTITIGLR